MVFAAPRFASLARQACLGLFVQQKLEEEPNRNYYGLWYLIPEYLTAVWELVRGMTMGMAYGPEYKESWESIMLRMIGLVIPGLSAHGPPNYINSIRLGTEKQIQMSTL
ncbi:Lipase, class 3 [Artemisia annua]|uniref:Lipase, class 3 n=1 Tax=Artemisia annua TaxID=35608 RepID=A0A2U1KH02_ARTAN|nr:Lipase, class 3 [Artemisia annua]